MKTINLNDNWTLTVLGENVYNIPETPIETKVPSTVYGTLLEKNLIPDPFYRDNELTATKLMENDFAYETDFTLCDEALKADRLFLRFEGIDTLADIYLNGKHLGSANNMNRVWEYDITAEVMDNPTDTIYHLKVVLHSPTRFIREENEKCPVGGSSDAMPGFPHIRKAACMFGWDWGPRLPDAGLFRPVSIQAVKTARIAQVYCTQQHQIIAKTTHGNTVSRVQLTADAEIEWMPESGADKVKLLLLMTTPDGVTTLSAESAPIDAFTGSAPSLSLTGLQSGLRSNHVRVELTVTAPQLWWPNGYGEQTLYRAEALLLSVTETAAADVKTAGTDFPTPLDVWHKRIGLRTMTVNTDPMPDEVWDPHLKDQEEDLDDGSDILMNHGEKKCLSPTVKPENCPAAISPSRSTAFRSLPWVRTISRKTAFSQDRRQSVPTCCWLPLRNLILTVSVSGAVGILWTTSFMTYAMSVALSSGTILCLPALLMSWIMPSRQIYPQRSARISADSAPIPVLAYGAATMRWKPSMSLMSGRNQRNNITIISSCTNTSFPGSWKKKIP